MIIKSFLASRNINKEFFNQVPEDKFDFRIVNSSYRKSDSVRESLVHQIDTTRDYINGIKTGVLKFDNKYEDLVQPDKLSKAELLIKLEETEEELINVLVYPKTTGQKVKVPWSNKQITLFACLCDLNSHEVLHTGWNLAVMDHLNIRRFAALKKMWG